MSVLFCYVSSSVFLTNIFLRPSSICWLTGELRLDGETKVQTPTNVLLETNTNSCFELGCVFNGRWAGSVGSRVLLQWSQHFFWRKTKKRLHQYGEFRPFSLSMVRYAGWHQQDGDQIMQVVSFWQVKTVTDVSASSNSIQIWRRFCLGTELRLTFSPRKRKRQATEKRIAFTQISNLRETQSVGLQT